MNMLSPRFTKTTVLAILDELESSGCIVDVCRKYGISDTTLYRWRSTFGAQRSHAEKQQPVQVQHQLNDRVREASEEVLRIRKLLGLGV